MPSLPPELNIGQEQPPVEDAGRLSEWLTRTVININGALQAAKNLVPTSVLSLITFSQALREINTL